jgi:paraquat-inducible protein B
MSNKANPMVIGGFVLGALTLMVVAILVFSTGALFRKADQLVSYFPGTVQGLRVGAPVEFQGVQIGRVRAIKVDFSGDQRTAEVSVYYELWPDTLRLVEGQVDKDRRDHYRVAVQKVGLRAQLTSVSLVTGQYLVSLVNAPDTPATLKNTPWDEDFIEIPAIPATRDRIADMLKGLTLDKLVNSATDAFDGVKALTADPEMKALAGNANQLLSKTQKLVADVDDGVGPLLKEADGTLADYSKLAKDLGTRIDELAGRLEVTLADISTLSTNLNAQVGPVSQSARGALGDAGKAFRSISDMVGTQSSTRYDLDLMLKEGAGAARSLRILADYLEQNPDALIKGRY